MKKILFLFALFTITFSGFAQKVKIKDGIANVDGNAYVKWEKRMAGNEVAISGLNATEEEVSVMYESYKDPNEITQSNPEGKVRWVEFNFLTLDLKCEISSRGHKGLVKLLYLNKVFVDGALNVANAEKFVKKYGTKFSDNRPGNNVNIIINN